VSAAESGPLIVLTGEVDITTAAERSELVTGQLAEKTLHLTVDVSGLDFADTAAIRVFFLAARTVRQRGGGDLGCCARNVRWPGCWKSLAQVR
jgi:anti-anti-sigma factor